jgi:hypothetical protein
MELGGITLVNNYLAVLNRMTIIADMTAIPNVRDRRVDVDRRDGGTLQAVAPKVELSKTGEGA